MGKERGREAFAPEIQATQGAFRCIKIARTGYDQDFPPVGRLAGIGIVPASRHPRGRPR